MIKEEQTLITAICPNCDHMLRFWQLPQLGQKVTCPSCSAYLRAVNLAPLELNWDAQFEKFCQKFVGDVL